MKILCVIDSLRSGGAQRQLVELAKGFVENGDTVTFLVYHSSDFYKEELLEFGINITYVIEPNYLKRLLKMRRFIRNVKFDVVLSFLEASNFICEFSGLPFRNWKLIVGERSANPNIYKSIKLRIYRYFHSLADYVVANSKANLEIVSSINPFLSKKKSRVIYNLLDLSYWSYNTNKVIKVQVEKKFVISIAASHMYVKNLIGLVESVSLIPSIYKDRLQIQWYGEGAKFPYLDNSFNEAIQLINKYGLNNVFQFHEETRDIRSVYQESDAIGLFSLYEGFPNTICEGMAASKPVLCSRISDIPLFLDKSEFLFDPNNYEEIKNVIMKIMDLSDEQLNNIGKKNRHIAEHLFDRNNILNQYYTIMK